MAVSFPVCIPCPITGPGQELPLASHQLKTNSVRDIPALFEANTRDNVGWLGRNQMRFTMAGRGGRCQVLGNGEVSDLGNHVVGIDVDVATGAGGNQEAPARR